MANSLAFLEVFRGFGQLVKHDVHAPAAVDRQHVPRGYIQRRFVQFQSLLGVVLFCTR